MSEPTVISRRDFLKLMALVPATLAARPLVSLLNNRLDSGMPNVLIFVFDAWTASNFQLYGYHRRTMPNLERFAERAFVFHNHYSSGNFTAPGTASLLTGLQPWDHRSIHLTAGGVTPNHQEHNIFAALSKTHSTFGYAQNPYADILLNQFENYLDSYYAKDQFNLEHRRVSSLSIFKNDARIAFASFENNIIRNFRGRSGSLYLGMIQRLNGLSNYATARKAHIGRYPAGMPAAAGEVFLLENILDGAMGAIHQFESPTLAYFHFFPPHDPYAPKKEFTGLFDDGWVPPEKPTHPLSLQRRSFDEMRYARLRYDQYQATWDAEFARFLDYLETSGLLEKSIVIFTSDHGELFERGEIGHNTFLLSNPVVHVPLLISLPGQSIRKDIFTATSSVDLLPTIAHLISGEHPAWTEESLLPGLGGEDDPNRAIYSFEAKTNSSFLPFDQFSISILKQNHRLIYYHYPYYSDFEFYNLGEDIEETNNLFSSSPKLALLMKDELLQKIEEFNYSYQKS
jgi:arylsulfatase A-like enzyme